MLKREISMTNMERKDYVMVHRHLVLEISSIFSEWEEEEVPAKKPKSKLSQLAKLLRSASKICTMEKNLK